METLRVAGLEPLTAGACDWPSDGGRRAGTRQSRAVDRLPTHPTPPTHTPFPSLPPTLALQGDGWTPHLHTPVSFCSLRIQGAALESLGSSAV